MADSKSSSESAGGGGQPGREPDAYFFLIKRTNEFAKKTKAELEQSQNKITEAVKAEGGRCEIFETYGAYDFHSKVTGISRADAPKIKKAIEASGNVTATMLEAHKSPLRK